MEKFCRQCQMAFDSTDTDKQLLGRLEIDEQMHCPRCSEQRRFAFRNESVYYHRKCDATGKNIISIYAPDAPYKVYEREAWFSDRYDPTAYGRDWNMNRPFFDQLKELSLSVPYEHMVIMNSTNCEYCNFIVNSKDCYLSVRIVGENIFYSYLVYSDSKDCMDCHSMNKCQLCYECVDCANTYACRWCRRCKQCSDCAFCIDCTGCRNCFGCTALVQKEHCFFNEQLSPENYRKRLAELDITSYKTVEILKWKIREFDLKRPHRYATIERSEDVSGDYILKSRNVARSFDIDECQDVADSVGLEYCKDVMRGCFMYHSELGYEHLSSTHANNTKFCYGVYNSHDLEYCIMAHAGTRDCFGSIGLKGNRFLILNKQYSENEYFDLKGQIVRKMKAEGEYGQFFPPTLSAFAYNETIAQQLYPLTKKDAEALGFRWKDRLPEGSSATKVCDAKDLPDTLANTPDDVLQWAIRCTETGKAFRVTKHELDFYRAQQIPLPRLHPDERHRLRTESRRPRILHDRKCAKCGNEIHTTYAPDRPETVYCEECYLATVY